MEEKILINPTSPENKPSPEHLTQFEYFFWLILQKAKAIREKYTIENSLERDLGEEKA